MTLSYIALWGVVMLSYLLGYCTGALVKQMSLTDTVPTGRAITSVQQTGEDYEALRTTLHERNLAWWREELERRQNIKARTPPTKQHS